MMDIKWKLNSAALERQIQRTPGKKKQINRKIAMDWVRDMRTNMSKSSPSAPGNPPGVVTGNLVNSIEAREEGDGYGIYGADYGLILESGSAHMESRPFIRPSAERVAKTLPKEFEAIVE